MRRFRVRFLLSVSALSSAVRHFPGIGTHTPKIGSNTFRRCVSPLLSLQPPLYGIFRLGQCHFPLCMWIIEIRLSTVIVHCVEPSVIVNQNVLRDFSTQEKGGTNERLTTGKRQKHDTTWASIYSTLYIYAIVYVWIWRIWKYMLTNLYRVFYVMWNTWSRCSLLSLALLLFLSFVFSFFLFCWKQNISEGLDWPCWRLFRLTRPHVFILETLDPVRNADWVKLMMAEKNIVVHSCWLKHWKGREVDYFRPLVDKCLKIQYRISWST